MLVHSVDIVIARKGWLIMKVYPDSSVELNLINVASHSQRYHRILMNVFEVLFSFQRSPISFRHNVICSDFANLRDPYYRSKYHGTSSHSSRYSHGKHEVEIKVFKLSESALFDVIISCLTHHFTSQPSSVLIIISLILHKCEEIIPTLLIRYIMIHSSSLTSLTTGQGGSSNLITTNMSSTFDEDDEDFDLIEDEDDDFDHKCVLDFTKQQHLHQHSKVFSTTLFGNYAEKKVSMEILNFLQDLLLSRSGWF
jgi:hypothetical protein